MPAFAVQVQRDHAVILARREAGPPRVAGIFHAQHAFRIPGCLALERVGDVARILLRLGQVDRDFQPLGEEAGVFADAVYLDIVRVPAHLVEPFRRFLRRAAVFFKEACAHLIGRRRYASGQLRRKQVARFAGIVDHAATGSVVAQRVQRLGHRVAQRRFRVRVLPGRVQTHGLQKAVARVGAILRLNQSGSFRKIQQPFHRGHIKASLCTYIGLLLRVPGEMSRKTVAKNANSRYNRK